MMFKEASKLDEIVSKAMEKAKAPGVSLALLKDGEIVYKKGYGARDLDDNPPATPDTLYGIGSCTKSFISLATMMQIQAGKITLDTPVRDHLPVEVGLSDSPITVRSLMSHSSGFPSLGTADIMIAKMSLGGHPIPFTSRDDFYNYLNHAGDRIDAKPGDRYYYFNGGYTLLGLLLEKLTGESLEDYLRKSIWEPLGMRRTTFLEERFNADPDRMTAYWKDKEGNVLSSVHPFHELIYAAGGILSSVVESCSYIQMYLDNKAQLVDDDLLAQMVMIHSKRPDTVFGKGGYGYGWGVTEFNGEIMVNHTGSTGVSGASYIFVPERGIGVAYLTNMGYWSGVIPHTAAALLMDMDPLEDIPYLKKQIFYEKISGTYSSYREVNNMEIKPQGGVLMATTKNMWGETSMPLIPASDDPDETVFYIHGLESGPMKVWFELDEKEYRFYYERWVFKKAP
ncbi:hypothetical protein E2P71_04270 [Candidatus Bathyarchaeota archaeon]|nr:hypothetical protein E2P71_04270 [Candidatus Bathyarchaeota archaeon]